MRLGTGLSIFGVWLLAGGQLSAGPITFATSSAAVSLGNQTVETVIVSGLGGGIALGTYDVNIAFAPAILSLNSAVFGTHLDVLGLGDIQSITPGAGTFELFELSLDSSSDLLSLQPSTFILATLTFNTLAVGTSPLTITVNAIGDQNGNSLSAGLQSGSVAVSGGIVTPEPSAFGTLGLGLAAIAIAFKHRYSLRC